MTTAAAPAIEKPIPSAKDVHADAIKATKSLMYHLAVPQAYRAPFETGVLMGVVMGFGWCNTKWLEAGHRRPKTS